MDIDGLLSLGTEDALNFIVRNDCNFENVLKRLPESKAIQFVHVISNVAALDRNVDNVVRVLTALNTDEFMDMVIHIVQCIDVRDNTEIDQFLDSVIQLVNRIFMRMPGAALKTLGLLQAVDRLAKHAILNVKEQDDDHLSLYHKKRDELEDLRKIIIDYMVQTQRAKVKRKVNTIQPPENFREIPILPTTNDIFIAGHGRPFLRKNLKQGAYDDLDHYLDVQFRLFREDCISQLRSGIMEYIEQKHLSDNRDVGRLQDARLYKHAKLLNSEMTLEGRVHVIQLDSYHARKIRWESGNRLVYGSLLCLSPDDFQTLWFGVVMESDPSTLKESHTFKAKLSFEDNSIHGICGTPVTIVESSAYFEAYRHVLKCLQKIKPEDLPFQRYIIECRTDIRPPSYVLKKNKIKFDLYPNIEGKSIDKHYLSEEKRSVRNAFCLLEIRRLQKKREDKYIFDISNNEWPSAPMLHLDDSQYEAFKAALMQEFTLIQGPPGTGKTYLGLQIAKALIRNKDIWIEETEENDKIFGRQYRRNIQAQRQYPMLVVCYTNHALDQFMEGIVNFMNLHPEHPAERPAYPCESVVRVGGRCTNDVMQKFSLKSIRARKKTFINYKRFEFEMNSRYREVLRIRHMLKEKKGVILRLDILSSINSLQDFFKSDAHLHKWLGLSNEDCLNYLRQYLAKDEGSIVSQADYNDSNEFLTLGENKSHSPREEVIGIETEAQHALQDRRIEQEEEQFMKFDDSDVGLDIKTFFGCFVSEHETTLTKRAKLFLKRTAIEFSHKASETPLIPDHLAGTLYIKLMKRKTISKDDRWKLYRYWVQKYRDDLLEKLKDAERKYEEVFEKYNKEKQHVDAAILKSATVIAMTTTGAARYQNVLQDVAPKIIIVEEAAEVLESHIVATLNPSCEHLILIGDHKQLEPKPAVYELALKYNLSLSMFERMIQNGLGFKTLQRQHRMRPGISQLVRPVYDKLEDNENVFRYPHVKGIKGDVFFINHNHLEEYKDDGRSYSNVFEAKFIERLCWYLIQQDYAPSQISVLTPYSGQMFCIRDQMPREKFQGVRISILDNFQGEENDIILLSLVRSNSDGKIGFLDKENRVCVALSRAKIGLYVIGNIDMICRFSRKTTLWKKAITCLSASPKEHIGHAIPLYCQNHPDTVIEARLPQDFDKAPDGGCERPCDFRLGCGHACRYSCHPKDRDHVEYKCEKQCPKICERNHKCKRQCHHPSDCQCQILVDKELHCGHVNRVKCFFTPDDLEAEIEEKFLERSKFCRYKCQEICVRNHICSRNCHYPKPCFCAVIVKKELLCGHTASMKCHKDPVEYKCQVIVKKTLPNCEHSAEMPCYLEPEKYTCKVIVTRTLKCGHVVDLECHVDVTKYECQEIVTRSLKCGHEGDMKCYQDENRFQCMETVTTKRDKCDHFCTHPCWDKTYDIRNVCKELVDVKRMNCEHEYKLECHKQIKSSSTFLRSYKLQNSEKEVGPCRELILKEWKCHHPPIKITCFTRNTAFCKKVCGKTCDRDHVCQRPCHYPEDCKCEIEVDKLIPTCRHTQKIPCNVSPLSYKCQFEMRKSLPFCDHTKIMKCHESPEKFICEIIVEKTLPCGHVKSMKCFKTVEKEECKVLVEKKLICGHMKKIYCFLTFPYTGIDCAEVVRKTLHCGHHVTERCDKNVLNIVCKENTVVKHPDCSHKIEVPCYVAQKVLNSKSKDPVSLPDCQEIIVVSFDCGHKTQVPCFRKRKTVCDKACDQILSCGHDCVGKCASCFNGNFHVVCDKQCERILICGHMCKERSCGTSSLCRLPCQRKCSHTTCDQQCFVPCKPCVQPCSWKCLHFECNKGCGEICDRPRCEMRCSERIHCGHRCIGFCGEPCPDLCRECDKLLVSKITKRSNKQLHKIVFVQLQECKHIFEGKILDRFMDEMSMNSKHAQCPKCKTAISYHPRYNNILKRQHRLTHDAKLQLFLMAEKQTSIYFPLLLQSYNPCKIYLKEFGTFLLLYGEQMESVKYNVFRKLETLYNDANLYLSKMLKQQCPNMQMYNEIFLLQRKLCAFWQLGILLNKVSKSADTMDSSDEEEGGAHDFKLTPKQMQIVCDQERNIESIIFQSGTFDDATLEAVNAEVDKVVQEVSQIKTEVKNARDFTRMPCVVDAHSSFWRLCKNGHYFCSVEERDSCQQCCYSEFHNEILELSRSVLHDGARSRVQGLERKLKNKARKIVDVLSTTKSSQPKAVEGLYQHPNSVKRQGDVVIPKAIINDKENQHFRKDDFRKRYPYDSGKTGYWKESDATRNQNGTDHKRDIDEKREMPPNSGEIWADFNRQVQPNRGQWRDNWGRNNRGKSSDSFGRNDVPEVDWYNSRLDPSLESFTSGRGQDRYATQQRGLGRERGRRRERGRGRGGEEGNQQRGRGREQGRERGRGWDGEEWNQQRGRGRGQGRGRGRGWDGEEWNQQRGRGRGQGRGRGRGRGRRGRESAY